MLISLLSHFHALLKDPPLHCISIKYVTCNMIALIVTNPTYFVMVILISCDICQKVFVLFLHNQLNQITNNLQDIVTRYSFHGALCFPYNMLTNCLNASLCQPYPSYNIYLGWKYTEGDPLLFKKCDV
jgi:hypothetical protein